MRLGLLLFCLLALTRCDESPTGPSVGLDQRFTLAPGQTASVQGRSVRLRFDTVTGDSRCPADALCIQGGDATVHVQASGSGSSTTLELHTGDSNRASAMYGNVKVTLAELRPYPFSSKTIAPGDYRATLIASAP